MKLEIPVSSKGRTKAILKVLNPFIGDLTDKQLDLVACMIDLDIDILNKNTRATIRERLDMDKFTFNNYILVLKKKKILIQSTSDLRFNPVLKQYTANDEYTIKFIIQ